MLVLNLVFYNLQIIHLIVSVFIPLALIVLAIVYFIFNKIALTKTRPFIQAASRGIAELNGFGIELLPELAEIFSKSGHQGLRKAFDEMVRDSKTLYQSRWLPDPALHFNAARLLSKTLLNSMHYKPAATIFSSGLLCAVVAALLQIQQPVDQASLAAALIWIPPVLSFAAGLLLFIQARSSAHQINADLQQLRLQIGRHLPVFSDQAGIALVIDQMMKHDSRMDTVLSEFNQTVERLAESDMAEGIRRSVEQVLLESVAPPIQKSAGTLSDLAVELTRRQEQGMHELAGQFSIALSEDLSRHLAPVSQELTKMTALMNDVKNYIDYAMRALETTRSQSESVLNDTRDSLQIMAQAREDLSDDFAVFSEQLRFLSQTNDRLANLQSGNEASLTGALASLSDKLEHHSRQLELSLRESARSLELAEALTATQKDSSDNILASMEQQQKELASTSQTLHNQIEHFLSSSDQYVNKTLQDFDRGLAEYVERLSYTIVEIRDAVDALPGALRQRPDY
jgi:uncharacterized protein YoxC